MPSIDEFFPSKYLKASDLQGRRIEVVMATIKGETLGDDTKPVLYFEGKSKGLVLNRTNASTIEDAYGHDYSQWWGKPIVLYEARVDFQGRRVAAVRVEAPRQSHQAQAPVHDEWATQTRPIAPARAAVVEDDDIPFAPEMRG